MEQSSIHQGAERYRLCGLILDLRTRRLHGPGGEIELEPLVFDLLAYFTAHADRVVSKDELWREIWNQRPVSDSVIPHAVSKLRRALAGVADGETIAAVHGRGYRLRIDVTPLDAETQADDAAGPSPPRGRWILTMSLLLLAVVIAAAVLWHDKPVTAERVAFLPTDNQTGDAEMDWIRLGLPALMEEQLSAAGVDTVGSATVRSTVARYPELTTDRERAEHVASSTGAGRVLLPVLSPIGGRYRLTLSDPRDPDFEPIQLEGDAPARLALDSASRVRAGLGRIVGTPEFRRVDSGDAFVDEAFARGLAARLAGELEAAEKYFQLVLASVPGLSRAALQLARVHRAQGNWSKAQSLYEGLIDAGRRDENALLQADALTGAGIIAWLRGDLDGAEQHYQAAAAIYQDLGMAANLAGVAVNLGIIAANRGRFDEADAAMQHALSLHRERGDRYNTARTLKNLGVLSLDQGQPEAARHYLEQALEIRQSLQLQREIALTLAALAEIEMALGRPTEAAALQRRVIAAAREVSDPAMETIAQIDLATAELRLGRVSAARELAAAALASARAMGNQSEHAAALVALSDVARAAGNGQRARELLLEARSLYRLADRLPDETGVLLGLARLELDDDQIATAADWLDQLPDSIASAELRVRRDRLAGLIAAGSGRAEEAQAHFRSALNLAEAAGLRREAQLTRAELGLWALARGDLAQAQAQGEAIARSTISSQRGYRLLSALALQQGDVTAALGWLQARQELAGERWSAADESKLSQLRNQLSTE